MSGVHLACLPRITPAHAGKSEKTDAKGNKYRDHPRTRGEKEAQIEKPVVTSGSPPHTRGKALLSIPSLILSRITPAHAGKRMSSRLSFCAM